MSYAIISLGGKQYRVQEGDRLVVDHVPHDEGKTFHPDLLFVGGDGKAEFRPKTTTVTAKVVGHVLGEKIRVGKYRPKTGYRKHTGHRSKLSEIEIQSIGGKSERAKPKAEAKPKARTATRKTASKPRASTKKAEE